MMMHGTRINREPTGVYGEYTSPRGRAGHDIRLMILSIMEVRKRELYYLLPVKFHTDLLTLYKKINTQLDSMAIQEKKANWHRGYNQAFNYVVSKDCYPTTFLSKFVNNPENRVLRY